MLHQYSLPLYSLSQLFTCDSLERSCHQCNGVLPWRGVTRSHLSCLSTYLNEFWCSHTNMHRLNPADLFSVNMQPDWSCIVLLHTNSRGKSPCMLTRILVYTYWQVEAASCWFPFSVTTQPSWSCWQLHKEMLYIWEASICCTDRVSHLTGFCAEIAVPFWSPQHSWWSLVLAETHPEQ